MMITKTFEMIKFYTFCSSSSIIKGDVIWWWLPLNITTKVFHHDNIIHIGFFEFILKSFASRNKWPTIIKYNHHVERPAHNWINLTWIKLSFFIFMVLFFFFFFHPSIYLWIEGGKITLNQMKKNHHTLKLKYIYFDL